MAASIGLLIASSMQHRIVEQGQDTVRIHRATSLFAGAALLPFLRPCLSCASLDLLIISGSAWMICFSA